MVKRSEILNEDDITPATTRSPRNVKRHAIVYEDDEKEETDGSIYLNGGNHSGKNNKYLITIQMIIIKFKCSFHLRHYTSCSVSNNKR